MRRWRRWTFVLAGWPWARCEDCRHPKSEGTWTGTGGRSDHEHALSIVTHELVRYGHPALRWIQRNIEPEHGAHYTACDAECLHGAPIRLNVDAVEARLDEDFNIVDGPRRTCSPQTLVVMTGTAGEWAERMDPRNGPVEAPWRGVDVRILEGPTDCQSVVLCLRCWAERKRQMEGGS